MTQTCLLVHEYGFDNASQRSAHAVGILIEYRCDIPNVSPLSLVCKTLPHRTIPMSHL